MKSFSKLRSPTRAPNVQQINKLIQHIDTQQLSAALLLTQKMLASDPKHSFAWKAQGIIRHQENNLPEAITAFQQAYQHNRQDYEALENLAKLYFLQRDYAKAEQYFHRLIAIDPYDQSAIDHLIECLFSRGAFKESLEFIRSSLQDRLNGQLTNSSKPIHPDCDQAENEKLLWSTLVALAQAGVHAFPTSGTLLELQREGNVRSIDEDLEIGLPYSEMALACTCLKQLGWNEQNTHRRLTNPRSFTHSQSANTLNLSGFALEEGSQNVVSGFWQDGLAWHQQGVTVYPKNFALQQKQLNTGIVWEVVHVDEFLTALYGDWRCTHTDFYRTWCTKNLRSYTEMLQMRTLNCLRQSWSEKQFKKALKLAEQHLSYVPDDHLILRIASVIASVLRSQIVKE
jgi:tetratricopeptide (TPR) repeat protein